jgi:hypothetical protein
MPFPSTFGSTVVTIIVVGERGEEIGALRMLVLYELKLLTFK